MKNNATTINTIVSKIEERGCYGTPGPAARESGEFIDEKFIVIPRSELPIPTVDMDGDASVGVVTEYGFGGNTKAMRQRAHQYLAMADYLDDREAQKKAARAETKLKEDRYRVFKQINPEAVATLEKFTWETCQPVTQKAINRILELESQLAK